MFLLNAAENLTYSLFCLPTIQFEMGTNCDEHTFFSLIQLTINIRLLS